MGRSSSGGGVQQVVRDVPEEAKPYLYGAGDRYLSQEDYEALSPEEQAGVKTETVDGVERFVNPDYIQGLLPKAQELFTGEMPGYEVAGRTGMQEQATQLAQAGIGSYLPFVQRGSSALGQGIATVQDAIGQSQRLASQIPGEVRPGQRSLRRAERNVLQATQGAMPFREEGLAAIRRGQEFLGGAAEAYDPSAASAYFDPYQEAVIETTLADIERAGKRQLSDIEEQTKEQALRSGAFTNVRRFLEQQEREKPVREEMLRRQAATAAQLRSQGYTTAQQQAQQAFEQQQQRQMGVGQLFGQLGTQTGALGTSFGQLGQQGAAQAGQLGAQASQLGLQGITTGLGAQQQIAGMGQGLGQLGMQSAQMGGMTQQMGQADVNLLSQLGAQEQRQRQAEIDAARATAMTPYQQVGFFSDVIQGAPIGTAQTSFVPGASPFQQATGAAIAYGGLNRAGVFS